MKSLAELAKLRDEHKHKVTVRVGGDHVRIVVGMATCGIAAGAREVMTAMMDEVTLRKLETVEVVQTGCIGVCRLEPIVEVILPGQEKVTYVNMTPDRAKQVIAEHIVNGNVVADYTIGAAEAE